MTFLFLRLCVMSAASISTRFLRKLSFTSCLVRKCLLSQALHVQHVLADPRVHCRCITGKNPVHFPYSMHVDVCSSGYVCVCVCFLEDESRGEHGRGVSSHQGVELPAHALGALPGPGSPQIRQILQEKGTFTVTHH